MYVLGNYLGEDEDEKESMCSQGISLEKLGLENFSVTSGLGLVERLELGTRHGVNTGKKEAAGLGEKKLGSAIQGIGGEGQQLEINESGV